MCGICGITSDPHAQSARLMMTAMAHRGPDDEGVHVDQRVGVSLGSRRLSIIDVAGGHQPLSNEDGSVWAVFNGEIYNAPSLRARLSSSGHRFATNTDTETLVHLYEEYGDALPHALEGMFAFAIWDERRQRLLLARDRFGEKPLFYAERRGEVAFASELTALLAGLPDGGDLDEAAVDAFFVHGYVPGPASIVRGVRQLSPGHTLTWEAGSRQVRITPYWQPPYPDGPAVGSHHELVAEFRRLLEMSITGRLLSDVPVGVLLSGGVDSSLVAAMMAEQTDGQVDAFTVSFDVGGETELGASREAAQAIAANHHVLTLSQADIADRVPQVLARLDQPLADQALVPLQAVCEFAKSRVTVLVGGEGADELFGGYPRYRWLERATRLSHVVPAPVGRTFAAGLHRAVRSERGRRVADMMEPQTTIERHIDWVTDRRPRTRHMVYGPRLETLVGSKSFMSGIPAPTVNRHGPDLDSGDLMILDQKSWLPDNVLAKADRASMLASVEIRTPYLHREIAEFAASLPASAHVAGRGKGLVRSLLAQVAPSAQSFRRKAAFTAPAAEWLRGPLAPLLAHQINEGALVREGWFARAGLAPLVADHVAGIRDHSRVLWPVLALGLWLDGFRENHGGG